MRGLFLMLCGISFGMLASAGVFTVLVAVGIVPRFAGRTHTANRVVLYEEMVIFGTILGGIASVFSDSLPICAWLQNGFPEHISLIAKLGQVFLAVFGLFAGMFVGCLALAIAEMLDSIPIFARRIAFRHGLGLAVLAMALGKVCGSLFYFWSELHQVVK